MFHNITLACHATIGRNQGISITQSFADSAIGFRMATTPSPDVVIAVLKAVKGAGNSSGPRRLSLGTSMRLLSCLWRKPLEYAEFSVTRRDKTLGCDWVASWTGKSSRRCMCLELGTGRKSLVGVGNVFSCWVCAGQKLDRTRVQLRGKNPNGRGNTEFLIHEPVIIDQLQSRLIRRQKGECNVPWG